MGERRFFISPEDVRGDAIRITDPKTLHHMGRVLRLVPGDALLLADGEGWEYRCVLERMTKEEASARIEDKQKNATEPSVRVTLYQGVPKGSKMEQVVQKCVELGVFRIVPVFMARTVAGERERYGKKLPRLQAVAEGAAKQAGRGVVPEVAPAIDFSRMLEALRPEEEGRETLLREENAGHALRVLFPYENEEGVTIREVLRGAAADVRQLSLVIGPEGGFADEEAAALMALSGCRSVSLGKRILRTETAGMAALAMILYELEL